MAAPPSVEEVRPGRCPGCGAAARPVGGRLGLHGHGLRERQQRGPAASDSAPVVRVVALRRYRCVACAAVIAVVPRDVESRRHYSRPAIALALALWSLTSLPPAEVRRRISPWPVVGATAAAEGWVTLRRWARAGRAGRLFGAVGRLLVGTLRQVAGLLAAVALGHAPPILRHLPREAQVFHGAVAMA
jgi:hypothetical protein